MQKQKQDRHSPHDGYKYKSLFIIIKSAMNVLVFKIRWWEKFWGWKNYTFSLNFYWNLTIF